MLLSQLLWTELVSNQMTFTDVPFSLWNTPLFCATTSADGDLAWTSELRLTGKSSSRHLQTTLRAGNAVKSCCQISSLQKVRSFQNGIPLWEELLHTGDPQPPALCCANISLCLFLRVEQKLPRVHFLSLPSLSPVQTTDCFAAAL